MGRIALLVKTHADLLLLLRGMNQFNPGKHTRLHLCTPGLLPW